DVFIGVRAIDEHEPGAAMMRGKIEGRRVPVELRDALRVGRPFGLRLGEAAARARLVDERAFTRRQREFRRRVRWKIERENGKMGGGVDGEVQGRTAIEGADLDDFIA